MPSPKWFLKFCPSNTSLRDESRPGRSLDLDQDAWRELVECSQWISTWELALDIPQSTIWCHLKKWSSWEFGFLILLVKRLLIHCDIIFQGWKITDFLRISLMKNGSFMTMFNTKSNVDWQRRIFAVYLKDGVSRKEGYAVCMMGLPWYCSFQVFKLQSKTQCRQTFNSCEMCAWKI